MQFSIDGKKGGRTLLLQLAGLAVTVIHSHSQEMDYQTKAALWLARSPLHKVLAKAYRKLDRYMDLADNWNNGDEKANGEAWLIGRLAPHLKVAFDVGANLGNWSRMLLEANPNCIVHAFEPSPSTFANLQNNGRPWPALATHRLGLGEKKGTCSFHDYGENSGLSSFASRRKSIGLVPLQVLETPLTTFDDFCASEGLGLVDFVKVDTEGYEMPVLRGMHCSLRKKSVAMIQFEYGGTWLDSGETLAGANELLLEHGYQLYKLRPTSLECIQYDCRRHECFKYANFVAVASPEIIHRWSVPILQG